MSTWKQSPHVSLTHDEDDGSETVIFDVDARIVLGVLALILLLCLMCLFGAGQL